MNEVPPGSDFLDEGTVRPSDSWISDTSYWVPRHLVESAWLEHAPFAFWLVDAIRPAAIAELGTHNGFSYFVFCETIVRLGLPTRTFALDSWQGDDQAGFYGADVYENVSTINKTDYSAFSTLLRGYFDDSLDSIPDGSIDLLHIDGRHGYDDVRHDFEAWRPKLSDRGVVIFHDIAEHQEGFGVWQFWEELAVQFPSFAFDHGHGLGVLAVGSRVPPRLRAFFDAGVENADQIKEFYLGRGRAVAKEYRVSVQAAEVPALQAEVSALRSELQNAGLRVEEKEREIALHESERLGLVDQVNSLHHSTSWRLTRPLRLASDLVHRRRD
ncbi:class I SAM-dependent methyltransferase [Cryobacterium mannosilyticum]|uniref:class I SAM-dependent methyltransferase n=1 Tax=Cryobacterium mannosilyticum TaxID=1259190 RepID=UPI00141B09C1|nr:class I SAM-dependent methyltransferase [Cryobacterium mannosilyticum]